MRKWHWNVIDAQLKKKKEKGHVADAQGRERMGKREEVVGSRSLEQNSVWLERPSFPPSSGLGED